MEAPPPLPSNPTRSWWSRNWWWFVPAIGLTVVMLLAGIAGIVALFFGLMKSSDAYAVALARASASPAVIAELGGPIKAGYFVTGNIQINGPSGRAELAIPIGGPKGTATIYVSAVKSLGTWRFNHLIVKPDNVGETIDLSDTPLPTPPTPLPAQPPPWLDPQPQPER